MTRSGQDLAGALDARRQVLEIANDNELDANTKLFALCLVAYLTDKRLSGHRGGHSRTEWTTTVGDMMYPPHARQLATHDPAGICRRIIAADIPRYEPPTGPISELRCQSPKSRGPDAGKPCGKPSAGRTFIDRDPDTGWGQPIGYCRNHAHPTLDQWRRDRYQAWEANGRPSPPPNTGGHLQRHFGNVWDAIYDWADPTRQSPADQPAPQLTVIHGEARPLDDDPHPTARGLLRLCQ